MMHRLPRGSGASETAKSPRAIGVCGAMTIFHALDHWSPGKCEGARQAKVGENATGGLQHMGALRPDLSIAAMITPPEVANTGPGVNRGSGGGARGCGSEERVCVHARTGTGGIQFPIAVLSVCCLLSDVAH